MLTKDKLIYKGVITRYKWLFWIVGAFIGLGLLAFLPQKQPSLSFSISPDQLAIRDGEIRTNGFYGTELDPQGNKFIWTNGAPSIEFYAQSTKPLQVTLQLRSALSAGGTIAPLSVVINDVEVTQLNFDPNNLDFQTFSFKTPTRANRLFKLELQTTTFVPPGDPRHLGFMVKSISIDKSEIWAPIAKRLWLYWLIPVMLLLLAPLAWVSRRTTNLGLRLANLIISLSGLGSMGLAFYILLESGSADSAIYSYWLVTTAYLGLYFALVLANIPFGKSNLIHRLGTRLNLLLRWFKGFTTVESSAEASLREYYHFSPLIFIILALAFIITLNWAFTIMPSGIWLVGWIMTLVIVFGVILILALKQLKQGKIATKQAEYFLSSNNASKKEKKQLPLWIPLVFLFLTAYIFTVILNSFNVQWAIWDASSYDKVSKDIVKNGFAPDPSRPPGYVYLVSHFYRWFGEDFYQPLYFFQYALNSLNAVLIFSMGLLVTGKRSIAWCGGLATALCPFTAGYAAALLTETPAIFLYTATIYLTILIIKRPQIIIYYALLGLTIIFLIEVRYNFQLFLLVPIGLILVLRGINVKAKLLNLAILGIMSITILTPTIVANYKTYDKFILFTPADNFSGSLLLATQYNHGHWFREMVDEDKINLLLQKYDGLVAYVGCQVADCPHQDLYRKQLTGFFKEYFELYGWNYAGRVVTHLWDYWNQNYLFPYSFPLPDYYTYSIFTNNLNRLYLVFMITGLWFLWGYRVTALPIYTSILYLLVLQSIFWVEPRYMLPIYPTVLFVAALGAVTFFSKFRQQLAQRRASTVTKVRVGKAWWILPVVAVMLIGILTNLVKSDTVKYTYNLQIQSALLVFNLPTTGYYASNISKLQQDLEKMTEMPEYALPENKIGVETSLARVYLRQKDYNRAIEYANKAIELNKGSFEAYHWRSLAYQNLGQTEAAARDKEMFEKLVPTDFAYLGKLTN